jgi:hypothetical protein
MTAVGENDAAVIDVTIEGFPPSLDCVVHASDVRMDTVDVFETNVTDQFKVTTDFQPAGYFTIYIICFKNDQYETKEESIFFGDKIKSSVAMNSLSSPVIACCMFCCVHILRWLCCM